MRRYDASRSIGSPAVADFLAARFPALFWARLLVVAPDERCVAFCAFFCVAVFWVVFFRVLADARVTFRAGFRWGLMLGAVPGRASDIRSARPRVSRS
jgi:hypothetical protein